MSSTSKIFSILNLSGFTVYTFSKKISNRVLYHMTSTISDRSGRRKRYWMSVHCETGWVVYRLWRDSCTIQPSHPPTPCRWMAATLRQQLDYMESFLLNECFGNAICSHCPLQRWAEWAKCRGTEHTSLSEVTDDFDSIVPLETGTSSHDSRVSDIEWHVYFPKHWHVSLSQ